MPAVLYRTPCRLPFNFPYVGVTKSAPPLKQAEELRSGGWAVGHNRVQVRGREQLTRSLSSLADQVDCFTVWLLRGFLPCSLNSMRTEPSRPCSLPEQSVRRGWPAARILSACAQKPAPCPRAPPQVGRGRAAYRRAQDLLQRWQHFHLGWATVNDPPVRRGAGVVVVARSLLLWTCNPLRICYVEEGAARLRRAGGGEGKGERRVTAVGRAQRLAERAPTF